MKFKHIIQFLSAKCNVDCDISGVKYCRIGLLRRLDL